MHLSSILEPDGPRSSGHYLVLRFENRSELMKLPETYWDLQKQVETLFNLKPNQYDIMTKELNVCAGEKVRIPEEIWGDVAKVLGNVDIVLRSGAVRRNPEGGPGPVIQSSPSSQAPTNRGTLILETPVINDEFIVLNLGELDPMVVFFPTSTFSIQVLDAEGACALAINIVPQTGEVSFFAAVDRKSESFLLSEAFPGVGPFGNSDKHNIVIRRLQTKFEIRFDSRVVGYVDHVSVHKQQYESESESRAPLTSIAYDLGPNPPFQGPISVSVYSGLAFFNSSGSRLHKPTLFQLILECSGSTMDSRFVKVALERVRKGGTISEGTGIKWSGQSIYKDHYTNTGWTFTPHTLYLVRFSLQKPIPKYFYVHFGVSQSYALSIWLTYAKSTVQFGENISPGDARHNVHHTITLDRAFFVPGEHSIGIVNRDGKVHVIFDFCQSTILPSDTLLRWKPKEVSARNIEHGVTAESYDFGI